ncbi:V-set and immunoglobulin domain-containing protein 10 [Rhinophrynus dorsalis]
MVSSRMGALRVLMVGELLLAFSFQLLVTAEDSPTLVGAVNETIVLPCSNFTVNTTWEKENITHKLLTCDEGNSSDSRFIRVNGSSLLISDLQIEDEGNYYCFECLGTTLHIQTVQLHVYSGSYNVLASISPTNILPNGTLYTSKGSDLSFNCSSNSYPEPKMECVLYAGNKTPELFHSVNGNFLNFSLQNVAPNYQGSYTCTAENPLSGQKESSTLQLLVYYPPASKMTCSSSNSVGFSELLLSCSWPGGYPDPVLQWDQDGKKVTNRTSNINDTHTLEISVDRSQLSEGQQFVCHGKHLISEDRSEKTCQLQIALPVLQSQPMRTCFSGENVTLSCTVSGANPPATITWLRNLSHPESEIQSGQKYQILQNSTVSYLTIVNCSHDGDEGYYVCKAENVLGIREINVWLAVNKPHNIVGLVSALLLLFLLVVAIITGTVLYCDPQVYLKVLSKELGESIASKHYSYSGPSTSC